MIKNIFRYQIWHLLSFIMLIAAMQFYFIYDSDIMTGGLWGISTKAWFWIAIIVPFIHQVYVWLIWRVELYYNTFTSRFGVQKAFKIYAAGFSFLFVGRMISIIVLAVSNRGSLMVNSLYIHIIAALIIPIVIYLFYSVMRYFKLERAYGIDHFKKNYNEPYVKSGIFRFTNNGMYIYGLMILYLPGLLLKSEATLLVALFNHAYIWVHY